MAERFGGTVAVVHADGGLDPLVLDLLQRLHAGGARLRFLTDFDQPGICLGSELVERFDASPWRMSVEIYQASVRSDLPPLGGRVGDVPWAPGLAAAMNQAGRAVPVEQLLDDVLAELDGDLTEQPVAAE